MIRFWSIAKNTFVQTIRQPVYGIIILATFAVIVGSLPLSGWTMATDYHVSDQKQLESLCLATLLVAGLLVAAFSASSVLSREIEDRTALTVISKPVARATFVLGKFVGVGAAVAAAFYLCGLVALMVIRHRVMSAAIDPYDWPVIVLGLCAFAMSLIVAGAGNYFFGWNFVSSGVWAGLVLLSLAMAALSFIGKEWTIVPLGYDTPDRQMIHTQLLVGIGLIFMAVLISVSVAVAASTRLSQVMTLLVCVAVFFIGSIHPYLFANLGREIPAAGVLSWVVPDLTMFFPLDALIRDKAYPAEYIGIAAAYCALYVAAVLAIGMALFERRQLEAAGASASMPGAVAMLAWLGRVGAIALALAALTGVSLRRYHEPAALLVLGGLLAGAVLAWALASGISRGTKWGYWATAVLVGVTVIGGAALGLFPQIANLPQTGPARIAALATALLAASVIAVLALPKTRRHFQ